MKYGWRRFWWWWVGGALWLAPVLMMVSAFVLALVPLWTLETNVSLIRASMGWIWLTMAIAGFWMCIVGPVLQARSTLYEPKESFRSRLWMCRTCLFAPAVLLSIAFFLEIGFEIRDQFRYPNAPFEISAGPPAGAVVMFLFALGMDRWVRRMVAHSWANREDRCWTCGFDLRGTDHKVCPECGRGRADQRAEVSKAH